VIQEEELRRHNKPTDAWISFNGFVYDITAYVEKHPPCTGRVCFVIALMCAGVGTDFLGASLLD